MVKLEAEQVSMQVMDTLANKELVISFGQVEFYLQLLKASTLVMIKRRPMGF